MKRFRFRLESVLRIREFEHEKARRAWLLLEAERQRRQARVVELEGQLARGHALLDEDVRAGADGERIALRADAIAVGIHELDRATRQLAESAAAAAEAEAEMKSAGVRLRSLEKLRETKAEQHRVESLAAEQAELEDLAMTRSSRLRSGIEEAAR